MSISTLSLGNANRATLTRLQTELNNATKESSTYRHADVGLTLGRLTGTAVSYRVQWDSIDAQLETNKVLAGRLDFAEDQMKSVADGTDTLSKALLGAEKYSDYPGLAKSALQQMQGALNTPLNGLYVFGGQNAGVQPMKDGVAGLDAAKAKYADFLSAIGKTSDTVTSKELGDFLGAGGYEVPAGRPRAGEKISFMSTVADPAWGANWSNASTAETEASISKSETVQTSVSGNGQAFRDMTAAYSMLAAIGGEAIGDDVKKTLAQEAAKRLGAGTTGITALRASVGVRQGRLESADTALTSQQDIVKAAFTRLEGVDETEVAMRITQLTTQLQASYSVTGRIQKLSILDYL